MAEGDDVVDGLYGLDPNDFVAARNDLVKRLKKEGDKVLAAEVAKLKRPTPAAWAVNQLARGHRDELEELVRLGAVVRDAQDRALAGDDPGDMRQAGRTRRDAVARLAERADRVLVERGGAAGAHAGEVTATLEAASLDAEAGAAVLGGRLAADLEPPSGFGLFDLTVVPAPRPKPTPAPAPAEEPEADRPAPGAARAQAERAERARRETEEAVVEARRRWEAQVAKAKEVVEKVSGSRKAVREAEAEISRLEDALSDAQRRLRAAARDAELAEDAASRAEDTVERAAERLRDAERRLGEL